MTDCPRETSYTQTSPCPFCLSDYHTGTATPKHNRHIFFFSKIKISYTDRQIEKKARFLAGYINKIYLYNYIKTVSRKMLSMPDLSPFLHFQQFEKKLLPPLTHLQIKQVTATETIYNKFKVIISLYHT